MRSLNSSLDRTAFPNASSLINNANLGRLTVLSGKHHRFATESLPRASTCSLQYVGTMTYARTCRVLQVSDVCLGGCLAL